MNDPQPACTHATRHKQLTILASAMLICSAFLCQLGAQEMITATVTDAPSAIIVLDASGSMSEPLEGEPKIEIAKRVVEGLLNDLDSELNLGLMAYGHRRKGDCRDIELLIPPSQVNRERFLSVVMELKPRGMTPLTTAVEQAAEALKYTEQRASVVLVSDGIETCKRDPCALAKLLNEQGIDFTVHVIAFDLKDEDAQTIRCLADETGGQFLAAEDAQTLQDALEMAVEEVANDSVPEVDLSPATLTVPPTVLAGATFPVKWQGPGNHGDRIRIIPKGADPLEGYSRYARNEVVELRAPEEAGDYEVVYTAKTGDVLGRADIEVLEAGATVSAPAAADAGSPVQVQWTGPANQGDYICFVAKGADESVGSRYAHDPNEPLTINAPVDPGEYEVHYKTGIGNKTLASADITITRAEATLQAPLRVEAGAPFMVEWTGPANPSELITLTRKGNDERGESGDSYRYANQGSPIELIAFTSPGMGEIRYMGRGRKILAKREIEVIPAEVSLSAKDTAVAGSPVTIDYRGPGNGGDIITIVMQGDPDGTVAKRQYTKQNPVVVVAPEEVGTAEIRYLAARKRTVMHRIPLHLTAASASLSSPAEMQPRSWVDIEYTGTGNPNDIILFAEPGAPENARGVGSKHVGDKGSLQVLSPREPGEYELRYVTHQKRKVLATVPVTVR